MSGPVKLAIVGAGWAGLAAAVAATRAGHAVTLIEATRQAGGRARRVDLQLPDGSYAALDNGQHILIGAYRDTLGLMRTVGVDPARVLHRMPLALRTPEGDGIAMPDWPAPLDAGWGIATARGWTWADKRSLLAASIRWQLRRFECPPEMTVAQLCAGLSPRVVNGLVDPLCVAALNTPASRASGAVFLRVLRDALFGRRERGWGASNLLLPRTDLDEVFPRAAVAWLAGKGTAVRFGKRVQAVLPDAGGWQVDGEPFDSVLLACPPWEAARLVDASGAAPEWVEQAQGLAHEAIATVYATGGSSLPLPMLALPSGPQAPAQFVFDRSQLGGPVGLLAFVASASEGDAKALEAQVIAQARSLGWRVQPLQTIVEKRATFACTPGLQRPPAAIGHRLWACGDYVDGPYPATLEGAVRSAIGAVNALL